MKSILAEAKRLGQTPWMEGHVLTLTDVDLVAIAILARRAEKHYGCPQDVEWAIDRHLRDGENVVMLQSRPETVWSQKETTSVSKGAYDPMRSIVSTLVSPLHKKSGTNKSEAMSTASKGGPTDE